mmetsp:Transcript_608/g.2332  ORF Transcript_608/g.2332 Transcript_608/m.2332 type:complete len:243 (+) Transcript_608:342-1070(+)
MPSSMAAFDGAGASSVAAGARPSQGASPPAPAAGSASGGGHGTGPAPPSSSGKFAPTSSSRPASRSISTSSSASSPKISAALRAASASAACIPAAAASAWSATCTGAAFMVRAMPLLPAPRRPARPLWREPRCFPCARPLAQAPMAVSVGNACGRTRTEGGLPAVSPRNTDIATLRHCRHTRPAAIMFAFASKGPASSLSVSNTFCNTVSGSDVHGTPDAGPASPVPGACVPVTALSPDTSR